MSDIQPLETEEETDQFYRSLTAEQQKKAMTIIGSLIHTENAETTQIAKDTKGLRSKKKKDSLVINDVADLGALGASTLDDMFTMFHAIKSSAEKDTVTYDLASIGAYLAEDYSSMIGDAGINAVERLRLHLKEVSS